MTDADPDQAWTTIDETVTRSTPDFDVITQTVELPDGTTTEFTHLQEPPAVVILPFTPAGDVVLVNEWRHAVQRSNQGVPAGGIDSDETVQTAAHRELTEETGYEADTIERIQTIEPANGISNTVHHHVIAHECTPTATQSLDDDETIDVETMALTDLRNAVRTGTIVDGRTILAVLLHAFRNP